MKSNSHAIIHKGRYSPTRIDICMLDQSSRKAPDDLAAQTEVRWERYIEESTKIGRKVWDGVLYRFENFEVNDNRLTLYMSTISTKEAIVFRLLGGKLLYPESAWSKNLFICALIRTSNGEYVFGELSGVTTSTRPFDLIGGVLSRNEGIISSGNDLIKMWSSELEDEINVSAKYLKQTELIGIVCTKTSSVGLIFHTLVEKTTDEIRVAFEKQNDGELKGVLGVPVTELDQFLEKCGGHFPLISKLLG